MQQIIQYISLNKANTKIDNDTQCFILDTTLDTDSLENLIKELTKQEKIILLYGKNALELCLKYNADGIILEPDPNNVKQQVENLRKQSGKNKYIGLITRSRRHESMLISESEPDFIIFKIYKDGFDNLKELTNWYSDFFLIQSAAWITEEDIPYQELKTDFIII